MSEVEQELMNMYISEPVNKYLEDLAAKKPAPGGGSAAAFTGALGTALLEMVCNFTIGKEKYKDFEQDITKDLYLLTDIRKRFSALIDEDVKAYSAIRDAFKTKDKKNIEDALKNGYDICQKICDSVRSGLGIALDISVKGNLNLITDVGCGAELLNAAFNSGVFNCEINLKGMTDITFAKKERQRLDALKKEISDLYKKTITKTNERIR